MAAFERLLEREQMEGVAVEFRVVHRDDVVGGAFEAPLGGRHEKAARDREMVVEKQVREAAAPGADGLVRLVEDGEVALPAERLGRLRERRGALVGGEDDFAGGVHLPHRGHDARRVGDARDAEVVDVGDEFVAFRFARGFVAAHAEPVHGEPGGDGFAQPDVQGLADEEQTRHGDDDAAGVQCTGHPPRRERLSRAARADEFAAGFAGIDKVQRGGGNGVVLVGTGSFGLRNLSMAIESRVEPGEELLIQTGPEVRLAEADARVCLEQLRHTIRRRADQPVSEARRDAEGERHERREFLMRERTVALAAILRLHRPVVALEGPRDDVDAVVLERNPQVLAHLERDGGVMPNILQLGRVERVQFQREQDEPLEGVALLMFGERGEP